jgi:glycosyltransferase involved in cell wall biosynthesis
MSAPSFSIVITTHNRLALLRRAIASAFQQTLPCQVVVVDDASTDGTQAYAQSLGDRITYRRYDTNIQHAGAVNAGVAAATGDWVKLLDDDDYLAPDCLAEMAEAISRHPQAALCSCQAAQVDEQGRELSRTVPAGPGSVFYIAQPDIHYGMLLEAVPFGTPAQVAVQRDAFLRSGGWDLALNCDCDDIDSWVRVAQYGDALFINRCLAYRTVWPGGYNQKIQLQRRLATNILMKERIYQRIHAKYQPQLPSLKAICDYLKLHWTIVALKQRQPLTAAQLALPAALSPKAWQLLRQAVRYRKQQGASPIPKTVLVNA